MLRLTFLFLLLSASVANGDMIRIDHREGTTGNYAPVPMTTIPNYVLTFDSNGNPVIGPGGGVAVTDGDKGDITVSGTGAAWVVDPGSITLAKMANLATGRLIGRGTASTGVPEAISIGPGLSLTGTTLDVAAGEAVSLDALPDGQEIRGATVASIIIGAGKGAGETTILAPWDVDGAVDGAPRITMTSGNSPTLAIDSPTVSWGDGIKQIFNPSATTAGLNVGELAGDPSAPVNGDLWYDSTANELTARINGANVALGAGGGGGGGDVTQAGNNAFTGNNSFAGTTTSSKNGAVSTPALSLTGTIFSGGDTTTTKPHLLIEPTGTTSTGWSTAGTLLGVNAASGFLGHLLSLRTNGTPAFTVDRIGQCSFQTQMAGPSFYESTGNTFYANSSAGGVQTKAAGFFGWTSTANAYDTADLVLKRSGTGTLLLGNASAPTDFNRLQLGGTTSAFPSIKRSGAALVARLADDSADTDLTVATEAYDATGWNGDNTVPTKDAVRDKIETMGAGATTAKGYLTSNQPTTSGTAVNVTGMSFAIAASEVWSFQFNLVAGVSAAGASHKFAIDVPTGCTVGAQVRGSSGTAVISADATLGAGVMSTSTGGVIIAGTVQNGANAGTVQLQFASGDGTNTATVTGIGSFFTATKMN